MKLCLIGHEFGYELEKLIRIFMPFEKFEATNEKVNIGARAITIREVGDAETTLSVSLSLFGNEVNGAFSTIENNHPDYQKECERLLAVGLYKCFVSLTGYEPQWGILTGVRPAKLFSRLARSMGESSAEDWFKNALLVSDKKISLCKDALKGEGKITALSLPKSFSLYISIPFCPSRCSYCSFVSHSIEQGFKLIPEYVEKLCEEIEITAKIAKSLNLRLETIYIGGGTPTTLSGEQLMSVMSTVKEHFDLRHLREYTVEAGRPDTITEDKLLAIKKGGATRISINPQTMNDSVLAEIGRRHTADETVSAFKLARTLGFSNINMDLIAGLPTDTFDSFKTTVKRILELNPESVTVHSLSMKRASTLTADGRLPETEMGKIAAEMVNYARDELTINEINPYYMYRQSKTVGNLENVGYAKKGYECLYNVYIMDETHTILACGASAVTKLKQPKGPYIERIFNYKYPYEYINRFEEMISRKDGINKFYNNYLEEL